MKINCLTCGHSVSLDDAYGDYEGEIKCFVCGSLMAVKTESDRVKSVKLTVRGERRSDEER